MKMKMKNEYPIKRKYIINQNNNNIIYNNVKNKYNKIKKKEKILMIKNNNKKFNPKFSINLKLMLTILIIFLPISLSDFDDNNFGNNNDNWNGMNGDNQNNFNSNSDNKVLLKVKGIGSIRVLPKDFTKPEIIRLNGNLIIENINDVVLDLTEEVNTVKLIWKSSFTSFNKMFENINSIISIDFSQFDTSKITDMSYMFYNCTQLQSINFTNFNTSSVTNMESMFSYSHMTSIDLSILKTNSVKNMKSMFSNCEYLVTLNLSNFNTESVENMEEMFYKSNSLVSLDLSNFITSSVDSMKNMFNGCLSLVYINLISFEEKDNVEITDIFSENNENLIYCINLEKSPNIFNILSSKKFKNDCESCSSNSKIIPKKQICIDDCSKDDTYKCEENNICYICNNDMETQKTTIEEEILESNTIIGNSETISDSIEINNESTEITEITKDTETNEITEIIKDTEANEITEIIKDTETNEITEITKDTETNEITELTKDTETNEITELIKDIETNEIKEGNECDNTITEKNEDKDSIKTDKIENTEAIQKISIEGFFKESEEIINEENITIKDEIIKTIKMEIISGNLNLLLTNVTEGKEDLLVKTNDTIYQITTTENQKSNEYNNISTIDLGECEDILKDKYNIDKNLSLIIFKVDYYKEGSLIPVICYEIYEPINKTQLDLNYCKDILINLNIPVSIDEESLYKYDPNSEYYNDECYAYTTENGTDIILNDRQNEYNDNNFSICESNCTLIEYDSEANKASCDCQTKSKIYLISDIIGDDTILSGNFSNTDNSSSSINTMKCIDALFSKEGLLTNIGSYILLFSIVLFIISSIIFYKCGYHIIESEIKEIISLKIKNTDNSENVNVLKLNPKTKKKKKKKKKINSSIGNPGKKKYIKKTTEKGKEKEQSNINIYNSKTELKNINFINKEKRISATIYKDDKFNKNNNSSFIKYSHNELNFFSFQKALKYDKRKFCQYYLSLLKIQNLILFSFYPINDYNIKIIKICLFFLFFDIYFAVNTLFFNDSTIHQIYIDRGAYNLGYFMPKIIYSFIISYIISILIKYFCLSEKILLELKNEENNDDLNDKGDKVKRCLIIKYIIFFVFSFIFLILFWYYLSAFCAVFKNSQVYLIKNTFISFTIALIYPFLFILLPGFLRFCSLKKKGNECIYKISIFMQLL